MNLLDKVRRCNTRDLTRYVPFEIGGERLGFVTPARADLLARYPMVFDVRPERVGLATTLDTPEKRTAALTTVTDELSATGAFLPRKGEAYAVRNNWHEPPRCFIDRALIPGFGMRAYGVHVNGIVRKANGLHLWIGTRAMSCAVEPGKLDNMVAGGQPAHLGLMDNVVKECAEEAGLPEALARSARPVGALSYSFDAPEGLKVDTLFCYDLDMPDGLTPANRDGEIAAFTLWPLRTVLERVRTSDAFKFNVNLVIIDLAIRHGVLCPEQEPDYEAIIAGLHERPE
jgi:hypothetical protein